jgi:hypothetical protein
MTPHDSTSKQSGPQVADGGSQAHGLPSPVRNLPSETSPGIVPSEVEDRTDSSSKRSNKK